jgi:hypothetical protein
MSERYIGIERERVGRKYTDTDEWRVEGGGEQGR